MVKGAFKQAVVVKGTGVDGFSSAVFISDSLPDEYLLSSADDFLRAARRIAGEKPRQNARFPAFFALAGPADHCHILADAYVSLRVAHGQRA